MKFILVFITASVMINSQLLYRKYTSGIILILYGLERFTNVLRSDVLKICFSIKYVLFIYFIT